MTHDGFLLSKCSVLATESGSRAKRNSLSPPPTVYNRVQSDVRNGQISQRFSAMLEIFPTACVRYPTVLDSAFAFS